MKKPPSYAPPVAQLLTRGHPGPNPDSGFSLKPAESWADYAALGITAAHVPDLVRMATDASLHTGPEPATWTPIHAWRALARLRAAPAVEPLIVFLNRLAKWSDDWGLEEVPVVLAMIGPIAVPALAFRDQRNELWARAAMRDALERIAAAFPDQRAAIVAILTDQLALARFNDPVLNGLIVGSLIELNANESVPVIERAFEQDAVDESCAGSLESVLVDIKLTPDERAARIKEQYPDLLDDLADATRARHPAPASGEP